MQLFSGCYRLASIPGHEQHLSNYLPELGHFVRAVDTLLYRYAQYSSVLLEVSISLLPPEE